MNELTKIINEKQGVKMNDILIILVRKMKNKKGREILLNELDKNVFYYLRIEKTPTFRIRYISGLTRKEIANDLLYHKELNPCNTPRVCVVPIRRNK